MAESVQYDTYTYIRDIAQHVIHH